MTHQLINGVLVLSLLMPLGFSVGCALTQGTSKPKNVFKMPTWGKKDSAPHRPAKDPDTPLTMGEAMMAPRNDVL